MSKTTIGLPQWAQWLYARPGAAPLLLALQDECDEDVLLLLTAIWLWLQRRALPEEQWRALKLEQGAWRKAVILPAREARRGLAGDPQSQALYQIAKRAEVEAELSQLARLAVWKERSELTAADLSVCLAGACEGALEGRRAELLAQLALCLERQLSSLQ
ncbi:TIGR02444 family protein [Halopseudomonas sp.]|uniref:TIGR02444 family protein n=1 Tax=Halopseudomonas sp. TaxID=2901191 RepID=UPI00311FEC33